MIFYFNFADGRVLKQCIEMVSMLEENSGNFILLCK